MQKLISGGTLEDTGTVGWDSATIIGAALSNTPMTKSRLYLVLTALALQCPHRPHYFGTLYLDGHGFLASDIHIKLGMYCVL